MELTGPGTWDRVSRQGHDRGPGWSLHASRPATSSAPGWSSTTQVAGSYLVGHHKTSSGKPGMTWPETVNEALCFGRIDGVRKGIDDDRSQIRFTRARQAVSEVPYIKNAQDLIAHGLMRPAGIIAMRKCPPSIHSNKTVPSPHPLRRAVPTRRSPNSWSFSDGSALTVGLDVVSAISLTRWVSAPAWPPTSRDDGPPRKELRYPSSVDAIPNIGPTTPGSKSTMSMTVPWSMRSSSSAVRRYTGSPGERR